MFKNVSNINSGKIVSIIFIIALLLRLGYVIFFPQISVTHDAADYDNLGRQITDGKGFSQPDGSLTAHRPPLYPFILSIFYYLFGHSYLAIRIFQSFISAFFCFLVYIIAAQLTDKRIAAGASLFTALYPAFISYSGLILTEIIAGFLILMMIYFLITALQKDMLKFYIFSGIFLGLLILCRQEMLLLTAIIPFALIITYRSRQKMVLYSLIVAVTAVLIISPWTIRNYHQFKAVIPVATGTGTTFWKDSHPANLLEWDRTSEYEPVKSLVKTMDVEKARSQIFLDRVLMKEGLNNIKSHPFVYIRLCSEHLFRFLVGSHSDSFLVTRGSFADTISRGKFGIVVIKLFLLGINFFLLFLAIFGAIVRRARLGDLVFILIPILYVAAIHTIFFGTVRYQIPVMPFILIFSVIGIMEIKKHCHEKSI